MLFIKYKDYSYYLQIYKLVNDEWKLFKECNTNTAGYCILIRNSTKFYICRNIGMIYEWTLGSYIDCIKIASSKISGITKTKCTPTTAGEVLVLQS